MAARIASLWHFYTTRQHAARFTRHPLPPRPILPSLGPRFPFTRSPSFFCSGIQSVPVLSWFRYPRLTLENRVYCSRVFRKLHVEVGIRQDGLQVLHVVLYPRYK